MTQPPQGPSQPPQGPVDEPLFLHHMGQEVGPYSYFDLHRMAQNGDLRSDTMVRRAQGTWFPASQIPGVFSDKEWVVALLLSGLIGQLGIDRFYLGHTGLGILKLLTCGGLGVWWLIDFVLIALRKIPDANGRPLR